MFSMNPKLLASLRTAGKYVFWTAVAAAIQAALNALAKIELPAYYVPVIAAILKAAATWVATQTPE